MNHRGVLGQPLVSVSLWSLTRSKYWLLARAFAAGEAFPPASEPADPALPIASLVLRTAVTRPRLPSWLHGVPVVWSDALPRM